MLGFLNGIGRGSGQITLQTLFALPSEFLSRWTPDFNIYEKSDGSFVTDFDVTSVKPTGQIYYADVVNGDDATGDGSEASPYQSIQKVYDEGGVDIRIKAGFYDLDTGFNSIIPNGRDVAFTAVDGAGSVIVAMSYGGLWWAQQTTPNDNVYLTTAAQRMFVLDRTNGHTGEYLLDGVEEVPIRLTEVGSIAACQSTPGSYFYSGTNLYVHTHDGRAPDSDLVVLSQEDFMWFVYGTDQKFYYEGLELWGRGTCRTQHSSINTNVMAAKDCGMRFSNWSISLGRIQGTLYNYFINCHFSDHTVTDGLGYAALTVGVVCCGLEVNCSSRRCGNVGGTNDNAFSAHNEANIIRLNGFGTETYGPIIADVLGSYSVNLNCTAGGSLVPTNTVTRVAFQVGTVSSYAGNVTSKTWIKNCTAFGEYYDRGQSNGGEFFDLGGFSGESTGGDYGTIN